MMIVVDVSIIVSSFIPTDIYHAASLGWLTTQIRNKEKLIAPTTILAEVGGAIARRSGQARQGIAAIQQVIQMPRFQTVPLDDKLGYEAATLAASLQLRGMDACYVAVAASLKIPLASLDKEQLHRSASLIQGILLS